MKELIERVKKSCGYASEAAIAKALGMSPQNFNSQKKTGGIKDSLILHAISKGINSGWLLTGQGEMHPSLAPDTDTLKMLIAEQSARIGRLEKLVDDKMAEQKATIDELSEALKSAIKERKKRDHEQEAHILRHADSIKKIHADLRRYGETGDRTIFSVKAVSGSE